MIEFGILGPLEVRRDGGLVELGGPRQRALLAVLLIRHGEPVGADGDVAWEAAAAAGQEMTASDAVAYALEPTPLPH